MAITINGSGTISGISAGGLPDGSVTADGIASSLDLSGKTVTLPAGMVTADDLSSTLDLSGKTVTLPAGVGGKVLQVVQTVKSDTFSTTSGTLVDVTGLSASITPSSASSKILVMTTVWASSSHYAEHISLLRDSTDIGLADAAGNRRRTFLDFASNKADQASDGAVLCLSGQLLDSPNTSSSITYKIQAARRVDNQNTPTIYINRSVPDRDTSTYDHRKISTITLMEIAG